MRFILCGGDTGLFQYVMLWFAFVMQKRTKPSTILVLYGAQGIEKSAIVIREHQRIHKGWRHPRAFTGASRKEDTVRPPPTFIISSRISMRRM